MQNSNISNIIWAYLTERRNSASIIEAKQELLAFLYAKKAGNQSDPKVISVLTAQNVYQPGILSESQEQTLLKNYVDTVDICLSIEANNRSIAESSMPMELAVFVFELFNRPDKAIIYNPFSGLGSFPMVFRGCSFICQEKNEFAWATSVVRLHAHNIKADIQLCDSIDSLKNDRIQADGAICCPPFGKTGDISTANITKLLYDSLDEDGVCAMIVPAGFLFSQVGKDMETKQLLLKKRAFSWIILLPARLFPGTGIQTALIVLNKRENAFIQMYDASLEYILDKRKNTHLDLDDIWEAMDENTFLEVPYDEIGLDGNLMPGKYIRPVDPTKEYVKLGDIATILSPSKQLIDSVPFPSLWGDFISASDLSYDLPIHPIQTRRDFRSRNNKYYKIEGEAIVFSFNPSAGRRAKVGYTTSDKTVYTSGTHNVIIPHQGVSREYLMIQLLSKEVNNQFRNMSNGQAGRISEKDLFNLLIPWCSLQEQNLVVKKALEMQMSESEKRRKEEFEKYTKDIHIRKHALSQKISAISSKWHSLETFMRRNGGSLKDDDIIGKINPIRVDVIMNQISKYLKEILTQIDNLADVEYDWGKPEKFDLRVFLEEYQALHRNNRFHVTVSGCDGNCLVHFSKRALQRVLDDIFSNAVAHGFTDDNRNDYQIQIEWHDEGDDMVVAIMNNGTPLKSDAREDMILSYGYSTSLNTNGHSGIGGHEIKSIMEQFGGEAEFISTPEEEFTITYRLVFKDAIINDEKK